MRFRLTWHETDSDNKYNADHRYEYLGDQKSIWSLWFLLVKKNKAKHVEVFNLYGEKQEPDKGHHGLTDSNI